MRTTANPLRSDARVALRGRTLLGGKLVSETGDFTFDCAIRDLSEAGARVKLATSLPIADRLWLVNIGAGVAHHADVQWSRGREHGLRFTETYDLKIPTPSLPLRLRLIWLECAPR